jgi:hypothetical protein
MSLEGLCPFIAVLLSAMSGSSDASATGGNHEPQPSVSTNRQPSFGAACLRLGHP